MQVFFLVHITNDVLIILHEKKEEETKRERKGKEGRKREKERDRERKREKEERNRLFFEVNDRSFRNYGL